MVINLWLQFTIYIYIYIYIYITTLWAGRVSIKLSAVKANSSIQNRGKENKNQSSFVSSSFYTWTSDIVAIELLEFEKASLTMNKFCPWPNA